MVKSPRVLIDGDIIAYRSAFSAQDKDVEEAYNKADEIIGNILDKTLEFPSQHDYQIFLTGSSNFRTYVAKTHPYKGNREKTDKPIHLENVRNYLVNHYKAVISIGEEADDLIAIAATKYGPKTIVASIDKDMLQIPCRHYNFNKNEFSTVSEEEGIKFFYTQILTGDNADNIKGVYGIGPVKAKKLLADYTPEKDLWEQVIKAYGGDIERVIENARLLWLRRYEDQLWEPPVDLENT